MEPARAAVVVERLGAADPSGASASLAEPSGIADRIQRPDRTATCPASTARPAGGARITGGFRGYGPGITNLTGPSGAPGTVLISGSRSATARGPVRAGAREHGSA